MKRVKLFDNYMTYYGLFGLLLMHALAIGLCIFFYIHFIVELKDMGSLVLIIMFMGLLIINDVMAYRYQLYRRFITRCTIDRDGIYCSFLNIIKWNIPWDEVRTYGITGHSNPYKPVQYSTVAIMFFSLDPDEPWEKKSMYRLSKNRILFQLRDEIWPKMSEYMPEDMVKVLNDAIDKDRDCFGRRKAKH